MRNKAVETACRLCDTMIRKFPEASTLPPEGIFHYHQGVFLSGMENTYKLCGDKKYNEYIKAWVDSIIQPDGSINTYDPTRLDDIQPGILLFRLIEETKDGRYLKALNSLIGIICKWKKNNAGGFWHKEIHPNQMWLDSLYMAGPIQALYTNLSGDDTFLEEAVNQAVIMYENMLDKESGLMFHAWDESREEDWADQTTGLSQEVWGRAQGWYLVALLDIIEMMPYEHPKRKKLEEIEKNMLEKIMLYRDDTAKMWYQVVNKGEMEGNWIETSCSCLFTAAIAKATRMGILDSNIKNYVNESFSAILRATEKRDQDIIVNNVCIGTGVCDYKGYIERPTSENDLHGVGAYLLMCCEVARMN